MHQLKITVGDVPLRAALFDAPTAALDEALPFDAVASTWGDEASSAPRRHAPRGGCAGSIVRHRR